MSTKADVCLIVEGAYPYATGGVSSWIQSLVTNLPELTFSIMHIGARPDKQRKLLYTFPPNIIEMREVFINDTKQVSEHKTTRPMPSAWQDFQELHEAIAVGKTYELNRLLPILRHSNCAGLTASDLFYAPESWQVLVKLYEQFASDQPFVNFFWTFRWTYLPVFTIFEAALPEAGLYHAVSTGFSGLLGALAKIRTGRPFMLTEHGLYTHEREIEIIQSTWIEQLKPSLRPSGQRMSFFQKWWFNIYRFMEKISYDQADSILAITSFNQQHQLKSGADIEKARVIPNGINVQQLAGLRQQAGQTSQSFVVGFVGRIVPIKDVKTFIRALKIASQAIPNLEVYLIGPTEEDPQYFHDCQHLVELLDLSAVVHFTGSADVKTYYRQLDLLVLSSLSEGQPLVILEANCAGIPVVATEVGACREMLEGITEQDQALGPSGIITPVASPDEIARAIMRLRFDKELRLSMGRAGQERVQRFYRQEQLFQSYRDLYRSFIDKSDDRMSSKDGHLLPGSEAPLEPVLLS